MHLADKDGNSLSTAYVNLTDAEATDLLEPLDPLLHGGDPKWHGHVDSAEPVEVTVYRRVGGAPTIALLSG